MNFKDLRDVVDNEEIVRITVKSYPGNDGHEYKVKTGDMLLFDADSSIDGFEVEHVAAETGHKGQSSALQYDFNKPVLRIDVLCDMQDYQNFDWADVFNGKVIQGEEDFASEQLLPEGE